MSLKQSPFPPLPPRASLSSSYLNDHPRRGDEKTHFWHFSIKSSVRAKLKLSESTELSVLFLNNACSTEKQTAWDHCAAALLAWVKFAASSHLVSAVVALTR